MTASLHTSAHPSIVFEPARVPVASTRAVRTVSLNGPSAPQRKEAGQRNVSSLVLGAVCGLTLGVSLLLFGPSPDTTSSQPVISHSGTVVL